MYNPSIAVLATRKLPSLAHAGAPEWDITPADLAPLAIGGAGGVYCLFTGRWLGGAAFIAAGVAATALGVPRKIQYAIDPCYKARDASGKCWAMPSNDPSSPQIATSPAPVK